MRPVRRLDRDHFIQPLRIAAQFLQPMGQLRWFNANPMQEFPLFGGDRL